MKTRKVDIMKNILFSGLTIASFITLVALTGCSESQSEQKKSPQKATVTATPAPDYNTFTPVDPIETPVPTASPTPQPSTSPTPRPSTSPTPTPVPSPSTWSFQYFPGACIGGAHCGGPTKKVSVDLLATTLISEIAVFADDNVGDKHDAKANVFIDGIKVASNIAISNTGANHKITLPLSGRLIEITSANNDEIRIHYVGVRFFTTAAKARMVTVLPGACIGGTQCKTFQAMLDVTNPLPDLTIKEVQFYAFGSKSAHALFTADRVIIVPDLMMVGGGKWFSLSLDQDATTLSILPTRNDSVQIHWIQIIRQ